MSGPKPEAKSQSWSVRRALHSSAVTHAFFHSPRPLVFAHRGGSGLAPENTLAAFDLAVALGVDGLELDVRLSNDGVVVVHHDRDLRRTTNLSGPVDRYSADELARADAAFTFGPTAPGVDARTFRGAGIGVPTLSTVLERHRDVRVVIELKLNEPELARATVEAVRAAGADERVCLGSFGLRVLRTARALAPHIATSAAREEVRWALYRSWCRWPVRHAAYSGYQVPETSGQTRVVSPRFIADAHRAGLGVQVWTVDDAADAGRLLSWGADALISDRPDVVLGVITPFAQSRDLIGRARSEP